MRANKVDQNKLEQTKSLSFYKINEKYVELLSQLYDFETGEINAEIDAQLKSLTPSIESRCIAVANYIRSIEADKREIAHLKSELEERERKLSARVDKMEGDLISNMQRYGMQKVECPYFTIKLRKNPYSAEILNMDLIPKEFIRKRTVIKEEVKPDKTAISKSFIETGEQVPGTYVSQKTKIEIAI